MHRSKYSIDWRALSHPSLCRTSVIWPYFWRFEIILAAKFNTFWMRSRFTLFPFPYTCTQYRSWDSTRESINKTRHDLYRQRMSSMGKAYEYAETSIRYIPDVRSPWKCAIHSYTEVFYLICALQTFTFKRNFWWFGDLGKLSAIIAKQ